MNINKCKSCEYYEPFFRGCKLYDEEVYMGEGDFEVFPVSVKEVSKVECNYKKRKRVNSYEIRI